MKFLAAAFCYFALQNVSVAEVISLSWNTKQAAPVQSIGGAAQPLLPAFRVGLSTLPESTIVSLALAQPALLGLNSKQSAILAPLVAKRYELIAASPAYRGIPSLLPYCYSSTRPAKGAALIHIPPGANSKSPVVVFLHGYGGSFLWYPHWFAEALPNHIIIAPAYGISPADSPVAYLEESMAAASQRLGYLLLKPSLVGLSAGAFGACRAFLKAPDQFQQLICLAGYPPNDTIRRFGQHQVVRFLAGSREPFVSSGQLGSSLRVVQATCPAATMTLIPGGDHFFMLTHPDETRRVLKSALVQRD